MFADIPKNFRNKLAAKLDIFLLGELCFPGMVRPGNTKGGSITVPLTSCLTGFESVV